VKLLLDTHALAWWFEDSAKLGEQARKAIALSDVVVLVSVVSAYEMLSKYRLGKWPEIAPLAEHFANYVSDEGFDILPLSLQHAELAASMPISHRDPFDRLLIAQAQIEQALLVSNETLFDQFAVRRLW